MSLINSLEGSGERVNLVAEDDRTLGIIRITDGIRVGEVAVSGGADSLTIEHLCIDTEHRSYGAGSETARLLVAGAHAAGVVRIRSWAHPNLGLSVYFWSRMGFSPRHGEGPEGGIWFERGL